MKLVKEAIEDVLKPKQLVGKKFYTDNWSINWPAFVCEILDMKKGKDFKGEYMVMGDDLPADLVECKVLVNERLNEGPAFYKLDPGEKFVMALRDFEYHEFKELDDEVVAVMGQAIEKLQLKKSHYEKLLNGS